MAGMFVKKLQKHLVILVAISFGIAVVLGLILLSSKETTHPKNLKEAIIKHGILDKPSKETHEDIRLDKGNTNSMDAREAKLPKPDYRVHVFYYPWYGNPQVDGQYVHWNHEYMPHWNKQETEKWPKGNHKPPDDIGANFFPELGAYSSKDRDVVTKHMQQIRKSGIGVLAVSWYPPNLSDRVGTQPDSLIPLLLDIAHLYELKVCLHIEPYQGRTAESMKKNLKYAFEMYASHPAYYKQKHKGKDLPIYYVYDSYMLGVSEWSSLLKNEGKHTIRGSPFDGIMIGLLVEEKHKMELLQAGFDGFYTYFASHGFSHGSQTFLWKTFASFAKANDMLFIPSCGPGYMDTRVRPWNARSTKNRNNGEYYDKSWAAAVEVQPPLVSITSFNEWHEGTQIESAVPKSIEGYTYEDYKPNSPDYYLTLTHKWVFKYGRYKRTA